MIQRGERPVLTTFGKFVTVRGSPPSSFRIFTARASDKFVNNISLVVEPFRLKLRRDALARASVATPSDEPIDPDTPPLLFLMVYRMKNVQLVKLLLQQVGADTDVRLWALDEIAPELSSHTLGCGPGVRFSHLNRLYNEAPIREGSWVILADDDVFFSRGSLGKTINLMKRAGFSLAQPGQSAFGWWSSLFIVARPFHVARDTNYVEQGPLVIADPEFSKQIFPLPDDNDMGWGIEAEWFRLGEGRFRAGIIDECHIVHWSRSATSYTAEHEGERMQARLSRSGVSSIWELQSANECWWKWRQSPPWKGL